VFLIINARQQTADMHLNFDFNFKILLKHLCPLRHARTAHLEVPSINQRILKLRNRISN
jgi:hypothetical protein